MPDGLHWHVQHQFVSVVARVSGLFCEARGVGHKGQSYKGR